MIPSLPVIGREGFLYLQSLYHFIPDRMQSNWFSNIVHCSLAVGIVTIPSL